MSNGHAEPIGGLPLANTVAAAPARQAYLTLLFVFTVVPILAGIDKFLHLMVDWDMYLAPWIARISPIPTHNLMMLFGIVEIIAGLIVAFKPKVGAWIVFIWLWLIIINLLSLTGYYDIVLRDFGLSLGAYALVRLSEDFA